MSRWADLHIHTHFSDSSQSPGEVIEDAHKIGLDCIAITDHDTIDGIEPTMEAAKEYGIEVISGIELSCETQGKDVHVLAYCFDYKNKELNNYIETFQNARIDRMKNMIGKLSDIGITDIELDAVCGLAESKSVGRPHLAQKLMEAGHVSTIKEAFDKYIADGGPAYVPKFKQTPEEAFALIERVGGISVLAHPMITQVDELIPQFVEAGLRGIEALYPNTPRSALDFYRNLAEKHGLLITGGSDAHGKAKTNTHIGKTKIPYELVEELKAHV